MKRITLKRMTLLNFKGIRSLEADLSRDVCNVMGRNGTGKTTLFDAFTWVLFGKDSRDRKAFDIKTLGADGKAIAKLPHEVTAIIEVDGVEISLTRRYNEKWTKKRGSAVEEFTGHEEERLYNDVPCSLKEWNEKIAAICPESVFKTITSPTYFVSMRPEVQREVLMQMAGGFTDEEVVASSNNKEEFQSLLDNLSGKSMDEYKREISAKKKRIKAEIDALPERIDERKRDNEAYESINYFQVESELKDKEQALAELEKQCTKVTARINASQCIKQDLARQLADAKDKRLKLASQLRNQLNEEFYRIDNQRAEILNEINRYEIAVSRNKSNLANLNSVIESMTKNREALMAEYKELCAMTLDYGENAFICPTCGQHLDLDGIEKKKAEMEGNFNAQKAARLKANKEKGMQCSKTLIAEQTAKRDKIAAEIDDLHRGIGELKDKLSAMPEAKRPTEEYIQASLESNEQYCKLIETENELTFELDRPTDNGNMGLDDLQNGKSLLSDSIAQLKATLEGRIYKQRNNDRIAELEEQLRNQNEAYAQLEGIEYLMAQFSKARIEAVENKINSLFALVRFKMFDTQINGGEVETCEATVDGVPYSTQNNAMKVNMGLDIINAICKYQGIAAPIFIDNCESILEPMQTIGQQVRLIVADQEMTIN